MLDRKRIGEILVDLQVLHPAEVDRVLNVLRRRIDRQKKFGQMACDMGLIQEEHILAALAVQMELLPNIEALTLQEILDGLLSATGAEA